MSIQTVLATPVDDLIEARVRAIPQFQNRVFVGHVPEGDEIPVNDAGFVYPYVVLLFGGLINTARRDQSIAGTRHNIKYHSVNAFVVAPTERLKGQLGDAVRDALEGFQPNASCGEMMEETAGDVRYPADVTLKPIRYTYLISFGLLISP